jgi:hypothetical protein
MSPELLQQTLGDLPRVGKLIKHRPYRQVWRFEFDSKPYYLKFYPIGGARDWLRRRFRGSPAMREFQRLQWLQKAGVPAPRAVAVLMGFHIKDQTGDAVILEGIEPSIQVDRYLNQHELRAEPVPHRLELSRQLGDLLAKLGKAHLGHSDLHLGNFVLKDNQLYLLDAYSVHRAGLRMRDLEFLALSTRSLAFRSEILRVWKAMVPASPIPTTNRRAPAVWRGLLNRAFHNDRYFGHFTSSGWSGHFFRHAKFPHRWSPVSRLNISEKDWAAAFPLLLQQMESGQFETLKSSPSGDVLAGEVILGGHPIPIVIKRPRRKYWYRYLNEIGRGTRPRRAWIKSWQLVVRNLPTAWPLLLMEKRKMGYATDALAIFERIDGPTLASIDPEQDPQRYDLTLSRCGALLRRLEQSGLYLYDAKAQNWIIRDDPVLGPTPMLIDTDSIRRLNQGGGLPRLLRSLQSLHPRCFTPAHAQSLVNSYSPSHAS